MTTIVQMNNFVKWKMIIDRLQTMRGFEPNAPSNATNVYMHPHQMLTR